MNASASASNGVISLYKIPGEGKSGTSRMYCLISIFRLSCLGLRVNNNTHLIGGQPAPSPVPGVGRGRSRQTRYEEAPETGIVQVPERRPRPT